MSRKVATRASYGEALRDLGATHSDIVVLDADLSVTTQTQHFAKAYPDRFFNMGIAECNMAGVAAGLATAGKIPVMSTFAIFAAGRAWEQIRNSIAYPQLNVKICATNGGLSVGEDGGTHQCTEDLSLMRTIPNMTVICPCDGHEVKAAMDAIIKLKGPAYVRLGRMAVEVITDQIPGYRFEIGKGQLLRSGTDVTIVACGITVQMSFAAAEMLAAQGISARVINMPTIKPLDKDILIAAARETGAIVTSEEHSIIGGLGSAVAEYLAEHYPVPVMRHGVEDQFGRSGTAEKVLELYGITSETIVQRALDAVKAKKR